MLLAYVLVAVRVGSSAPAKTVPCRSNGLALGLLVFHVAFSNL
jgi:hypothetical protein